MTEESLKRGQQIKKEIFSLDGNREHLKSLTPYILVSPGSLSISVDQIKFTEKELDDFYRFINQVIQRIDEDIIKLQDEFKQL